MPNGKPRCACLSNGARGESSRFRPSPARRDSTFTGASARQATEGVPLAGPGECGDASARQLAGVAAEGLSPLRRLSCSLPRSCGQQLLAPAAQVIAISMKSSSGAPASGTAVHACAHGGRRRTASKLPRAHVLLLLESRERRLPLWRWNGVEQRGRIDMWRACACGARAGVELGLDGRSPAPSPSPV